jgi:thiol:disulfide interchange protein
MKLIKRFLRSAVNLSLLSILLMSQHVYAIKTNVSHAATEQVQADLIASVNAVVPGEEVFVGVHQNIIPGWHTYWKNPGDSGVATAIQWTLPAGTTAGAILWPSPSRHSLGPVTNYGYANQVTLPTLIKVPYDLKTGSNFEVAATVDWLVCHEECIPQQVRLKLSLPVVNADTARKVGHPLIDNTLAGLAKQPLPNLAVSSDGKTLKLQFESIKKLHGHINDVWFYPAKWGWLPQSAPQVFNTVDGRTTMAIKLGDAPLKIGEVLEGELVVTEAKNDGIIKTAYIVSAPVRAFGAAPDITNKNSDISFVTALFLALLGGIILNLMPCVFPVLSIKALSLVKHSNLDASQKKVHSLVYTAGVLVSFALLGIILILLKAGGAQIGWGFQFQSPSFVMITAYLMFLVGLNLSGVFSFGNAVTGVGSGLADKSGYVGSFFTGVLATIVATPCTAPFMAAALGYALTQTSIKLMAIFLSLGLGLALPYLALAYWPKLQALLPKPGIWMERAKQVLAFPMYAAAVWLVWVLAQQTDANAVAIVLGSMTTLALIVWAYEVTRYSSAKVRCVTYVIFLVLFIGVVVASYGGITKHSYAQINAKQGSGKVRAKNWEPYSEQRLNALLADGKPVLLNFTAAWCISCLVNERIALSDPQVTDLLKSSGTTYLKGDWTNRDPEITRILAKFGRSGVPLYVHYAAGQGAQPHELPQILTPDIVIKALKTPG